MRLDQIIAAGARPSEVACVDGFTVSVIAGPGAYSTPRAAQGPYEALEVGYPSERPEPWDKWSKYAEQANAPTETVYGWVPVALVRDLIAAHGGER